MKVNNRAKRKTAAIISLSVALVLTLLVGYLSLNGMPLDSRGLYRLLPWVPSPGNWPDSVSLGLDLKGGVYVEYEAGLSQEQIDGGADFASLMEATQTVVDIYSRFLFESAVFEARKTHIPSAQELNQMMLDAQEQAYGDGLDKDIRHPSMWVNKSHYYNVGLHFYNFPYAFGLLFGLGVFARYQKEGASFLPKYDAMLASCGSGTIAEVAASVGIDVRSVDYWRSALDVVRGEVDEFVKLCK